MRVMAPAPAPALCGLGYACVATDVRLVLQLRAALFHQSGCPYNSRHTGNMTGEAKGRSRSSTADRTLRHAVAAALLAALLLGKRWQLPRAAAQAPASDGASPAPLDVTFGLLAASNAPFAQPAEEPAPNSAGLEGFEVSKAAEQGGRRVGSRRQRHGATAETRLLTLLTHFKVDLMHSLCRRAALNCTAGMLACLHPPASSACLHPPASSPPLLTILPAPLHCRTDTPTPVLCAVAVGSIEERLPLLASGAYDVALSALSFTPGRAAVAHFPRPFYYSSGWGGVEVASAAPSAAATLVAILHPPAPQHPHSTPPCLPPPPASRSTLRPAPPACACSAAPAAGRSRRWRAGAACSQARAMCQRAALLRPACRCLGTCVPPAQPAGAPLPMRKQATFPLARRCAWWRATTPPPSYWR